jgi:hypothetical protein
MHRWWHRSYEEFLRGDPRRRGDALELGHDWFARDGRYRACWYEETGELTIEGLGEKLELEVEDFHAGVAGPVEVIAVIPSRTRLEAALGRWPAVERARPRTVARLRQLTR